jgi:putative acetyltransferase
VIQIRPETIADREAIRRINTEAFGGPVEADLVDRLRADGDLLLSLVAVDGADIVGHVAFSRLLVEGGPEPCAAVALAPVAVEPDHQKRGIGRQLIQTGHGRLAVRSEALFVVLGDPSYYSRFGYRRDLAEGFQSVWQGDALQALALGEFPRHGRLRYARAFDSL